MHRIGICDDELSTCSTLETSILRFFSLQGKPCDVQVWSSIESLRADLNKFHPDILFLDIEFPSENGVSIGKYIREELNDETMDIIFISHKTNYALDLFQIHPYDFLIKPISEEILHSTLNKLLRLEEVRNNYFRYSYNKVEFRIQYNDIIFFCSRNKHVYIHVRNHSIQSYCGKLSDIIEILPSQFALVSKSYVVNMDYILSWRHNCLTLSDGTLIQISQSKRREFKKQMLDYRKDEGGY